MIIKMKKTYVIVEDKDLVPSLERLRQEGVLHVVHTSAPASNRVQELRQQERTLSKVIDVLSKEPPAGEELRVDDWRKLTAEIMGLLTIIGHEEEAIARWQIKINQWERWGDFNPEDIETLAAKGIEVRFVEVPLKEMDKVPEGVILKEIFRVKEIVRCCAISRGPVPLPFAVLPPPDVRLSEMQKVPARSRARIKGARSRIRRATRYLNNLEDILSTVREDLQFQEVCASRGQDGPLSMVQGYCPADKCEGLARVAQRHRWAVVFEDPAPDEDVPTLLRNPRWVELVRPVFQMIGLLPGYKEFDISLVFLFFFSVFFGMLISDAGYGLVFLLLTALFHGMFGKKVADKTPFFMMYVLSTVTVIWGMLTGVFFGQAWMPPDTIRPLVPWLDNTRNVEMLCFLIGAVHLTIARLWRGMVKAPSLKALAEVGWTLLVWGMFFLADALVLDKPFPPPAVALFYAGPALVIFFTHPQKNILKAAGVGLSELLLDIINTFTDLVSYIRLFAVGLASVAVADAFNEMAMKVGFNHIVAGLIAALILVLGHVFNMTLGGIAILVHGLRLNVLEFSRHMGLEWTGSSYNPFRKIRKI